MARSSKWRWGHLLLGIWLILMGLSQAIGLGFHGIEVILGLLAIGAGVLLLSGR